MQSTASVQSRTKQPLSEARSRQLMGIVVARAQRRRVIAIARIVAGLPLCMMAPLVLGSLFWFIALQFSLYYPWLWFFAGFALLTIPLLFRTEVRTGGDYLGSVACDSGPELPGGEFLAGAGFLVAGAEGMAAGNAAAAPRKSAAGLVELFLIGPRMVVRGVRHLRDAKRLSQASIYRAVTVLWQLLVHQEGVLIEKLAASRDDRSELAGSLAWLSFYDWIGVGAKGGKAFLFNESRKYLTGRLGELSG